MKKSSLALSIAAAVAGVGFAGAANAVVVYGVPAANAAAVKLSGVVPEGIGHILLTPHYNVANGNSMLLTLTNTDEVNGKAVKVRFRGAANSDSVIDFTVLLSPGDVWTGSVSAGANGYPEIVSPKDETTCVLPYKFQAGSLNSRSFRDYRLDRALSTQAKAAHMQEGYIEYVNMADITRGSDVYNAIVHDLGAAPCTDRIMNELMNTTVMSEAEANALGLAAPTGGLMGNWTLFRNANLSSYAGGHSAIAAVDGAGNPAAARLFFSPQTNRPIPTAAMVNDNTAEPLMKQAFLFNDKKVEPAIPALYLDLPDLSTPYTQAAVSAEAQTDDLSAALAATQVKNEYVATTAAVGGVNWSTDWVFTQPTRRYHVAINYANPLDAFWGAAMPVTRSTAGYTVPARNAHFAVEEQYRDYYGVRNLIGQDMRIRLLQPFATTDGINAGDVLCLLNEVTARDREERELVIGDLSPSIYRAPGICGESAVYGFNTANVNNQNAPIAIGNPGTPQPVTSVYTSGQSNALAARLTVQGFNLRRTPDRQIMQAGWATATPREQIAGKGIPVLGFAATAYDVTLNGAKGNYSDAVGHRYVRPLQPVAAPLLAK